MPNDVPSIIEYSKSLADQEQPQPLPAREYRMSVRGAAGHRSKQSGKDNVKLTFFVSPDQYPVDYIDGNPDGTTLDLYRSTEDTPMARWMMRQTLEALGMPLSKRLEVNEFIGRECIGTVEHEQFEGRMNARIKAIRAL